MPKYEFIESCGNHPVREAAPLKRDAQTILAEPLAPSWYERADLNAAQMANKVAKRLKKAGFRKVVDNGFLGLNRGFRTGGVMETMKDNTITIIGKTNGINDVLGGRYTGQALSIRFDDHGIKTKSFYAEIDIRAKLMGGFLDGTRITCDGIADAGVGHVIKPVEEHFQGQDCTTAFPKRLAAWVQEHRT